MQARFSNTLCLLNPQQLSQILDALLVPGLTTELVLLAERRHAEFVSSLQGKPVVSTTSYYVFNHVHSDDPIIHIALREFATLMSSAIHTLENIVLEPEIMILAKIKAEIISSIKDCMISEDQANGLQDIIEILFDPYMPEKITAFMPPWTCRVLEAEQARAPKEKPPTRNFLGDMVVVKTVQEVTVLEFKK